MASDLRGSAQGVAGGGPVQYVVHVESCSVICTSYLSSELRVTSCGDATLSQRLARFEPAQDGALSTAIAVSYPAAGDVRRRRNVSCDRLSRRKCRGEMLRRLFGVRSVLTQGGSSMKHITKLVASLGVVALLMAPSNARAQTTLTPNAWFVFGWSSLGTVFNTYALSTVSNMNIRLVDCCIVGDMFELFAGGSSLGQTSTVDPNDGTSTGAVTGDVAWATASLSKGSFFITPGTYLFTIDVIQRAACCPGGDAFIQATSTTIPEPGSVLLLATGLLGLAVVTRRRRKEGEFEG